MQPFFFIVNTSPETGVRSARHLECSWLEMFRFNFIGKRSKYSPLIEPLTRSSTAAPLEKPASFLYLPIICIVCAVSFRRSSASTDNMRKLDVVFVISDAGG